MIWHPLTRMKFVRRTSVSFNKLDFICGIAILARAEKNEFAIFTYFGKNRLPAVPSV